MVRRACIPLCLAALLIGCAPSFSPLYRDYDVAPRLGEHAERRSFETVESSPEAYDAVHARIRAALADAGWTEAEPAAPNVVSTGPRELSNWGVYRVVVSLDVVPIGERHVRVLFHPVRRFLTGGRSKISYLDGSMRRALLPELNSAFEAQGFYPIGTPLERDEEQIAGT
jgi:hypothetical protein